MQVAVIPFPVSEHKHEIILAIERAGMTPIEFSWNGSVEKLLNCHGYIIVGEEAPVMPAPVLQIIREQCEIGKPILGINAGAKMLAETGLVPGVEGHKVVLSFADIQSMDDVGANIRLSDEYQYNAFTRLLNPKKILRVQSVHAKSHFVIPPALLFEMQINGLNVFQYCDNNGNIHSVNNIAAISNKNGNVMAMMPHPECTTDGDMIFNSMKEYIAAGHKQHVKPLNYYPRGNY